MKKHEKIKEKQKEKKEKEKKKTIIGNIIKIGIFIIAVSFLIFMMIRSNVVPEPETSDEDFATTLAKCLTDQGVKMYGADWCPHCQNQKKMFGEAFKYIDYVDCEMDKEQCINAGVPGYPTWIINNTHYSGAHPLELLANISKC